VAAYSQCVWARCLLVGVPVVLGDGLGAVFAFMTMHMEVVVAVGDRVRGRGRRLSPWWPSRMVPVHKTMVLLIPEFCPGGQRQRLTVNNSTLLV